MNYEFLVNMKPEEIVKWFNNKGYSISWNWKDTWQEAHAKSFTVSKAMKLDILRDIHKETSKIFEDGISFQEFRRNLEPTLKRKGWWGKVRAADVPGYKESLGIDPEKIVQLGSPRRLKTIYDTNASVGYNSGRYKSQFENAENRPYWQYIQIERETKREDHSKLHLKVFRYDDPIWDVIYPPNGWHCGCRVTALTEAELKSKKLKISKGIDFAEFEPEEGWAYNPGKAAFFDRFNSKPVADQRNWEDFNQPDIRNVPEEFFLKNPGVLEPGKDVNEAVEILAKTIGVSKEKPISFVKTPIEKVVLRYDFLTHMVEKRLDQRERFSKFILPALQNPYEIYATKYTDGVRLSYISLFDAKYNIFSVIKIGKDGALYWNLMHARKKDMNRFRVGELIYKNKKPAEAGK